MKQFIIDKPELKFRYVVYEDSTVMNLDTGSKIKPSNDKRRPNECPAIYLKKKDDTRVFMYHDQLMMKCFSDIYNDNMFVHHRDGDIYNCKLSNLYVADGLSALREIHHETKEWVKVSIDTKLYYDYYICEDGRLYNATTDAFPVPFIDNRPRKENYARYNLYYGKTIKEVIHVAAGRLVAIHFLPKFPDKDRVMYNDGDYSNYDKSNLSWGDRYDVYNKTIQNSREFTTLKDPIMGKEKWKIIEIDGIRFKDEYVVSSFGRVWNKTSQFYCSDRKSSVPNRNNQYHLTVSLNTNEGFKNFLIHRLVAFMFVKNYDPENNNVVNHINGNPECNLAINLEWCTSLDNLRHAIDTNLMTTSMYINKVDDAYWRLNTMMAWIYAIKGMTDSKAYNFYCAYNTKFNDNIPKLTYEEFITTHEAKMKNDEDFKKISEYYKNNY